MTHQYTEDTIWAKDVRILQPKSGYRFAIDAVLLAHFLQTNERDEVLEIGTGVGVIAILLSRLKRFKRLVAVEIQEELADLARKNIAINHISNVEIRQADVRHLPNASFDLIFSNPPYRKAGSGKLNPNPQKAVARHELTLQLKDLFECAAKLLKQDGRLSLILPTFREKDLLRVANMHLQERRYVLSFRDQPPALLLATFSQTCCEVLEHSPLVIYDAPGKYSEEASRLLDAR